MSVLLVRQRGACLFEAGSLPKTAAGSVLLVNGYIPVALSNSEGVGSVWVLAQLPGAHLYIQVLGNEKTKRLQWARHFEATWKDTGEGKKMTKLVGL